MFKNFHEHYESPEESRTGSELIVFNTKYDRIKLVLSAILIPIACSFFYFLLSGHKYAELETAFTNTEITQTQLTNENLIASADNTFQSADYSTVLPATSPDDSNENNQKQPTQGVDGLTGFISADEDLQDITKVDINAAVALETQNIPAGTENNNSLDNNRAASFEMNVSDFSKLLPGRNLAELTEFLIPDSLSVSEIETGHQLSFSGRGQAEIALLVKTRDHSNELQSTQNNTLALSSSGLDTEQDTLIYDTFKSESMTNDSIDQIDDQNLESKQLLTKIVSKNDPPVDANTGKQTLSSNIDNATLSSNPGTLRQLNRPGSTDQTTDSGLIITDTVASNNNDSKLQEDQARVIMVDKIIGLLKSEVISTNATADAGKHKRLTNRHSRTSKKSYNINKLESILEDI